MLKENLIVAALAAVLLAGCGPSVPSVKDARKALERELTAYGPILEVERLDGRETQTQSAPGYVVEVVAATRTPDGLFVYRDLMGRVRDVGPSRVSPFMANMQPVDAGSIYVIQAEVTFRRTEKGWQAVGVERREFGLCPPEARSVTACRERIGL